MQESKYLELRIPAKTIDEDLFARLCEECHALGSASETDAESGNECRVAWFAADETDPGPGVHAWLTQHGVVESSIRFRLLEAQDWATAWQRSWQAMPIGRQLWVRPSFRESAPEGHIDIVLDPGMAFGTGTHPTTRLCLEAIESLCGDRPPRNVLDMGAGSGILAIAALKLGARRADAVDLSADAVEACRSNAAANGVELNAWQHDAPPAGRYDLVVANILAAPLIAMAEALAMCTDRALVLSGMLTEQVEAVRQAYEDAGLECARVEHEGEWAAIVLRRPS